MISSVFVVGILGVIIAQVLKIPFYYLKEKKIMLSIAFSTGSMPSSHTAFVIAATTVIGFTEGFSSALFGFALVVTFIIMHDARNVRGESGKQAKVLNEIAEDIVLLYEAVDLTSTSEKRNDKLKEFIGHTTSEIAAGVLVGLLTAIIYMYANNML